MVVKKPNNFFRASKAEQYFNCDFINAQVRLWDRKKKIMQNEVDRENCRRKQMATSLKAQSTDRENYFMCSLRD